jgi:hypothetical protein
MGWVLCCVMLIGAAERHADGDLRSVQTSLDLAKYAVLDAVAALWEEVRTRKHLVEGNALTDPEVYGWRIGVLYGLFSSLAIADLTLDLVDAESRAALHRWLKTGGHVPQLWGEGAVAHLVPWLVWLRSKDATMRPDAEIYSIADAVIRLNQPKSRTALPTPYYGFETVLRHQMNLLGLTTRTGIEQETFAGSAYTAELLLHLLVRTGMKRWCKSLWPAFTKLGHRRFCVEEPWHYCLLEVPTGPSETRIYQSTHEWTELKRETLQHNLLAQIPAELQKCPWLLSLWWQVAPHRLNADAARILADAILPGWGM